MRLFAMDSSSYFDEHPYCAVHVASFDFVFVAAMVDCQKLR